VKGFGGRGVNWVLRQLLVTFAHTMEQSYAAPDKALVSFDEPQHVAPISEPL
jgi:hypothetical protein